MKKLMTNSSKFREEFLFRNNNQLKHSTFKGVKANHQRKHIKLISKLLEKNGFDLDDIRDENAKASKAFVTKAKLKLSKRKPQQYPFPNEGLKEKLEIENFFKVDPVWAVVINHTMDSDEPGVADNFEVNPNVQGDIKAFVKDTGNGLIGIEAEAVGANAHRTIVLEYTFVPTKTGLWTIFAGIDFHGFFILYADDQAWNSREASVKLKVSISGSQYFLGPENTQTVLDVGDDNINTSQLFDDHVGLVYLMQFKQGDPVTITIKISMEAHAHGDDSHAELNFQDGVANFIRASDLFVFSE